MTIDEFAIAALTAAMEKAEPKLKAALARHGVTDPSQLPGNVAREEFRNVLLQTAAESFPAAQLDALKHGLTAFDHPLFGPAFARLKTQLSSSFDAFAPAFGPDAAIVLAAFGLPVAPFDRKMPRILSEPSNNIDDVAQSFGRLKTAYVGYSPCDIPFYMLITDCVRTMLPQINSRPQLRAAHELLERTGIQLPRGPFPEFQHGIVLLPREPADSFSTVFLNNPSPREGSVALYAGWTINGAREGAPNNGFIPVPLQFLRAAIQDPAIAMWIWKPVGTKVLLN